MAISTSNNKVAVKVLQNFLINNGQKLPKFGADGYMGNETFNAIDALKFPKYVKIALKEIGVKEIMGFVHNSRVLEYQATTAGKYSDDETPWCGSFISWVMKEAKISHNIIYTERAKEWIKFGKAIDKPVPGAIAIKDRVGGGHVCIVIGKSDDGYLLCVGGNQNDEVNISKYKENVFTNFRVPNNYEGIKEELLATKVEANNNVKES